VSVGESKLCQRLAAKFGAEKVMNISWHTLAPFILKSHANFSKG
jgi:hypothetical protein